MPNRLSRFWQELKRRRVVHVVVVYATAAFVIIELVNNVFEPLRLPDWTPTLIIILLIAGFPIAIIFSWIYDITSKGISRTPPSGQINNREEDSRPPHPNSRFDNSIAVLPFQDMSPGQDQEYFCDGIAEEIINVLTHVESLKVIARTSAFAFKNKQADMREIGQMLDVYNLLEGSIRKDGNQVRITVQLINAADGSHIWSERYDRPMDDIFAIQDEISLAIVDALKIKLLGEEKAMILKHYTENLEAYNDYLKGIHCVQMLTPKGIEQAIQHFHRAQEKDPGFALAYVGLAIAYLSSTTFGNATPPVEAYPKIKEYAKKAEKIDNSLVEVFMVKGAIDAFYHWNWPEAERNFKHALHLNPNDANAHVFYSFMLSCTKRHKEAISEAERAREIDPISSFANTTIGQAYFFNRQPKSAIRELRKVISRDPDYYNAHMNLGFSYTTIRRYIKAYAAFKRAIKTSDGAPFAVAVFTIIQYRRGKKKRADKLLESLIQRSNYEYVPPSCLYIIYRTRGEHDIAFKWFERACKEHDNLLPWLRINPTKAASDTDEQRYRELLEKVGLE